MVPIARLTETLKRCLWRQGLVHPENLAHMRVADGRFTLVIPHVLCEYEPVRPGSPAVERGLTTPAMPPEEDE
jgi:hypothetical protein